MSCNRKLSRQRLEAATDTDMVTAMDTDTDAVTDTDTDMAAAETTRECTITITLAPTLQRLIVWHR